MSSSNGKDMKVTINHIDPDVWKYARHGAIDDNINVDVWVAKAIMFYYHRRNNISDLINIDRHTIGLQ